jgi:integrase
MVDKSIKSVGKSDGQLIESPISEENLPSNPFSIFILAIRSPVTREKYLQRIGYFFDFLGIPKINDSRCIVSIEQRFNTFLIKAKEDNNWLTTSIVKYLHGHRLRVESKEITGSTLRNYIKPIKLFCEQMDIEIPWRKITRGMPRGRRYANDRAPTLEEIRKITEYPDRRIKPTIYLMASSGIRLGAFDFLKWGDIEPIMKNDNLLAAKIRVYSDEEDEYYSFITKEAYDSLCEWMKYRKECGEAVNESSWLMRNLWDVTPPRGKGVVTLPKKLKSSGVKRMMERALWAQGLRKELAKGKRRHEFQADHGFRKWFKTRCEIGGMKSINVETLMGHSIGIQSHKRRAASRLSQSYRFSYDKRGTCGSKTSSGFDTKDPALGIRDRITTSPKRDRILRVEESTSQRCKERTLTPQSDANSSKRNTKRAG